MASSLPFPSRNLLSTIPALPKSLRQFVATPPPERVRFAPYSPLASAAAPARLRTVDGLRALALALVLFNHGSNTSGFPPWLAPLAHDPHLGLGGHGVKLFFVISGFLVTSMLLRELERTGAIDGREFLLRRARRILPPYLALVLILGVLRLGGLFQFDGGHFLAALTFTGGTGGELGHLWSMAVQEQYYLAWPLILIIGGRSFAVRCALAAVILTPIARVVHATFSPDTSSLYLTNGASIDTLALGCLLALAREGLASRRAFNRIVDSPWTVPFLYVLAGASLLIGWRPSVLLRTPLVSLALVFVLERCLRYPDRGLARLLNRRWIVQMGCASFSIYLWQQPFLDLFSSSSSASFPTNILMGIVAGLVSWRLIERPLVARGTRPHTPAIAGEGVLPTPAPTLVLSRGPADVRLARAAG